MTPPISLSELEKLEREATPGPWKRDKDYDVVTVARNEQGKHRLVAGSYSCFPDVADSAFIAASRNALPELIAALRMAHAALTATRGELAVGHLEGNLAACECWRCAMRRVYVDPALAEIEKRVKL